MKHRILIAALASYLLTDPLPTFAAPPLINYQGRIVVGTTNFNSPPNGLFKFALVNADGTASYWTNTGVFPLPMEPTSAVSLPVNKGLYSVLLGDTTIANMAALPTSAFTAPDLRLRVWFSDGTNGFQQLTPDQRLAPTAYLADGIVSSANIADSAIVSSKVAPGAITGTQIATGTLDATRLAATGSLVAGQILSYDGLGLKWITPGGGTPTSGWALGGNGGTTATNFLGTTDSQSLIFKTANLERLRLTTSADLVMQMPGVPAFSVRNGLGVYGSLSAFDDGRSFAGTYVLGPVLYGHGGGGLGLKSSTNVETLALRWDAAGNVGIGAATPATKLEVRTSTGTYGITHSDGTIRIGTYLGGSTSGAAGGWLGTLSNHPLLLFVNGGQPSFRIDANGFAAGFTTADLTLGHTSRRGSPGRALVDLGTSLGVNYGDDWGTTIIGGAVTEVRTLRITGGADLAEPFPMKEEALEKGAVVVIDEQYPGHLKRSTSSYDTRVAGIVSGANGVNPGIALHQEGVLEGGQNVALSGRVYVRANAIDAPIRPGDLLTTSEIPGHAMKVTDHTKAQGAVIGKAMSSLDKGTGMVLVLVTLQ